MHIIVKKPENIKDFREKHGWVSSIFKPNMLSIVSHIYEQLYDNVF